MTPIQPAVRGECLGHGMPDWPEDLLTFQERAAYQRGVGDARRLAQAQVQALRSPDLHSAVRKVLQHHGLTKHGDGVVEADLIAALRVEELLAACKAIDTFRTFFDSCIPPYTGKGAREALLQVAKAIR